MLNDDKSQPDIPPSDDEIRLEPKDYSADSHQRGGIPTPEEYRQLQQQHASERWDKEAQARFEADPNRYMPPKNHFGDPEAIEAAKKGIKATRAKIAPANDRAREQDTKRVASQPNYDEEWFKNNPHPSS